jgi:putative Mg2+ transporter-C (MgtC) family protein
MEFAPLDIALRLGAAAAAGMVLGINRDIYNKPLGMRTLGLVALGAAIASVATLEYGNLSDHPDALSRVVQGIIQGIMGGISFIGAGVILRDVKRGTVEGLTTAATVWVAAALGIACGLAMWWTVAISVGMALLLLIAIGWVEAFVSPRQANRD